MSELADAALLNALDVARAALLEVTPADTVGAPVGHIVEGDHVLSLLFDCLMTGYPGWHWTVSIARVENGSEPSVLETELMPGGDALLAPEWVPWSERLADNRTAEELAAAEAAADALDALDDFEVQTGDAAAHDEDDDFEDEDSGDDELDGIDFGEALAASGLHPTETGRAEPETNDGTPDPPVDTASGEFDAEDDGGDEHD